MAKHFLRYWKFKNVEPYLCDPAAKIGWAASEQYDRVARGDEIWFVTSPPRSGELYLTGHLIVGWTGSKEEAVRILGQKEIWDASWAVISAIGTEELRDYISITDKIPVIRFQSESDRLSLTQFHQQLQSLRRLTNHSASMIKTIWYSGRNKST